MSVCPLGEGDIGHAELLRPLDGDGFEGYFPAEVIHQSDSDRDAEGVVACCAEAFSAIVAGLRT